MCLHLLQRSSGLTRDYSKSVAKVVKRGKVEEKWKGQILRDKQTHTRWILISLPITLAGKSTGNFTRRFFEVGEAGCAYNTRPEY